MAISIPGATHGNHRWQAGEEKVTCKSRVELELGKIVLGAFTPVFPKTADRDGTVEQGPPARSWLAEPLRLLRPGRKNPRSLLSSKNAVGGVKTFEERPSTDVLHSAAG
jgi:hypothetical protein